MCLPDPNEMTAISRWPADMQRLRGPIGEVFTRRPMATRTLYTCMRAWVIRLARRFT